MVDDESCQMCGDCCRLFYINLNESEYLSGKFLTENSDLAKFDSFADAEVCGAHFLQKRPDGSCIYLEENKCTIHADRPQVCHGFFCNTEKPEYQNMVKMVKEYQDKGSNTQFLS